MTARYALCRALSAMLRRVELKVEENGCCLVAFYYRRSSFSSLDRRSSISCSVIGLSGSEEEDWKSQFLGVILIGKRTAAHDSAINH